MVPKATVSLFMSFMALGGEMCTANGLVAAGPVAILANASRRHGTQVRACLSPGGLLRGFVQHWHGDGQTSSSAGTMTIQDDAAGGTMTENPAYMIANTAVSGLDSECATGITTTLITDCPSHSHDDDWAVYEFNLGGCTESSSYTFVSGNTVVLTEACSDLYPATVSGTVACPSACGNTACPTAPPTPAVPGFGGPAAGASAVGDPHLQNVHGERFDLMKPGKHVLISIPRGERAEHALLHVQAEARHLGGQCADMYFRELNITGSWAEAKQHGGYRYSASQSGADHPDWVAFGKVQMKVVHGRTDGGLPYLNLYVKHLGHAGLAVGGLLGEDDHTDAMTPMGNCVTRMALQVGDALPSAASRAVASFA
jgi:hypothetical protein